MASLSAENAIAVQENKLDETADHDFTVKTWKEDFCFVVEGNRFYVSRIILALASPVFERMFQADFKEKYQNEMELPGKLSADVEEFLKCIYPDVMKEVTIKNAFQIIALAEEYQIVTLKEKCEACFLCAVNETSSIETLFKILNVACLYSLNSLSEKCSKFAAEKPIAENDEANRKSLIPLSAQFAIQRKIIDKLRAKEVETNQTIAKLLREQQKTIALYKYHRAGVDKSEVLDLDDFAGWDGTSVYKRIVVHELYLGAIVFCRVAICKTQLQFVFEIRDGYVYMNVNAHESDVTYSHIKLVGNVVVFNGIEGKKNFCKKVEMVLKRCFVSHDVKLFKEIDLRHEGYSYNGVICVECNFFAEEKGPYGLLATLLGK